MGGWDEKCLKKEGDKAPPGQQPGQDVAVGFRKHSVDPAPGPVETGTQTRPH